MKKISIYDLPDRTFVPDGWYVTEVPSPTSNNIQFLMDKLNEIISTLNKVCGQEEDDDDL
jgi:hypothetical protein